MGIGSPERETDMAVQLMRTFGDNPVFELGAYGEVEMGQMGRIPFVQFRFQDQLYQFTYTPQKKILEGRAIGSSDFPELICGYVNSILPPRCWVVPEDWDSIQRHEEVYYEWPNVTQEDISLLVHPNFLIRVSYRFLRKIGWAISH